MNQSLEERVDERTAALTRVNAELESARAKADAANHDKTRFLAAASHDLLQPLNAARLYTSTLIERAKSTADFEALRDKVRKLNPPPKPSSSAPKPGVGSSISPDVPF